MWAFRQGSNENTSIFVGTDWILIVIPFFLMMLVGAPGLARPLSPRSQMGKRAAIGWSYPGTPPDQTKNTPTFLKMGKRPKGRRRGEASTHWDEDGDGYSSEEY